MDDLISRKKAIEAIEEMQKPIMRSNFSHEQFIFRGMSEARQAIIDLPSVQPQKGKWILGEIETGAFNIPYQWKRCSECGWESSLIIPRNFCPNCGADMREGEQDDN